MYLKELYLKDTGPLSELSLKLPFDQEGKPLPQILVGRNGAGKSTVLSVVADALLEAAVHAYEDVIPGSTPMGHKWYRVVGARTVRQGTGGSFALCRFNHDGSDHIFKEKGGNPDHAAVVGQLPPDLLQHAQWTEGSIKEFPLTDVQARAIFGAGVYAFFPTNRNEPPYWINPSLDSGHTFNIGDQYNSLLGRPIIIERTLARLSQWILSVLVEARADFSPTWYQGQVVNLVVGDISGAINARSVWHALNAVLKIIVADDGARLVWLGRQSGQKLGIVFGNDKLLPGLDGLSGGQASLLSIFGSLLQFGDEVAGGQAFSMNTIRGICAVDEVDAHMHVDLLTDALPKLIALFPSVQFILTCHSPFFGIGAEKHLSGRGVSIVEIPSGTVIGAEAYHDFQTALDTFRSTKAFGDILANEAATAARPLVWVAGETDPIYLKAASNLLGHSIEGKVDIEWIGAKDSSGQGFNTGDDALKRAYTLFKSNPAMAHHPILFLYDCDASRPDENLGLIHVRSIRKNDDNYIARRGIENLLPSAVFSEEFYDSVTKVKDYGDEVSTKSLNKMKLCTALCGDGASAANFQMFSPVLDSIASAFGISLQG